MTEDDSEYRTRVIIAFSSLPIPNYYLSPVAIYLINDSHVKRILFILKKTYLQHKDLARGLVDVELALVGPVGVDALPGEEVHDVLRSVLVAVRGSDLGMKRGLVTTWCNSLCVF